MDAALGVVAILGLAIGGTALPVPATAAIAPAPVSLSSVIQAAGSDPVIAAAGDIACDPADSKFNGGLGVSNGCRQLATSNLLVGSGLAAVLALGDNQYYCGSYQAFVGSYDQSWGRVKSMTYPSVGNHEYLTHGGSSASTGCDATNTGAAGYYQYFGGAAGDPSKGYYSFDIGAWHLISLNTQCSSVGGCSASSPQGQWLAADLNAHPNQCTLAFFHIPLFSSGGRASSNANGMWQVLYAHHADVILNGHDHIYERFAPQSPLGTLDAANGIREFIVGTGGANLTSLASTAANSEVRNASTFGVLALTLHPSGFDWSFVPEAGKTFTDSGSGTCHASGGGGTTAPTITSANSATFSVGSAGTFTVATTGSPIPAITKTGALPNGVTLTDNHNGTATLAGTPTAAGTYPLTIGAANGVLPNATQNFTLTVNGAATAPTITSANSATFSVGNPGNFTVTTAGSPAPAITETGALPSGVTFTDHGNGTASLAGTPATGTTGTYPLTIGAANGVLPNATQNFTLTVGGGGGGGGTVTLTAIADAKVDASAPTTNYATQALRVDGSPVVRSYLKFDASSLAGPVQGATLRIWATSAQGLGFDAFAVTNSTWSETGLTYANQPTGSISPTKLGSSGAVAAGTWKSVDVTALVTGPGIYSVVLETTSSTALALSSREDAAHAPQLVATLAGPTIPDAPTSVSATAGDAQAQVSWTAPLNNGGSAIIGYTVTGTPGGSASVAGNLTTAAVSGLTNGTSYAFTVHATNTVGNGPESAPSLAVTPSAATTAPAITSANGTTFTVGSPGSFTVTSTGSPPVVITKTGALPGGVTFTDNGNGTATLAGTPATAGPFPLTIGAANGVLPNASQSFTLTVVGGGGGGTVTLTPMADAYTDASQPTAHFGTSTSLRFDASPVVRSYLTFDLSSVSGTITKATLRVWANTASSAGYTVGGTTTTWTESGLTAANAPPVGASVGGSGSIAAGSWTSVDVTALLGGNQLGLALSGINGTAVRLSSRESGTTTAPQLILELGP